ncbi:MAG: hypothetical protein Q4E86_11045 [Lachnospiraceae bacterium]|nr:hypothetical protein [Lachnospiraceae bacterium]
MKIIKEENNAQTSPRHQPDGLSAKDAGEMGFHREFHDLDGPVCSACDCTGLIPAPPQSDAQEEAYEELYPFLPDAAAEKKKSDSFS